MDNIFAIGDSIMKGIVEDCSRAAGSIRYMISNLSFAEICRKRLGLEIRNLARFGGTIDQGMGLVERHKELVSDSKYCVIEYGGNDCSYHWSDISADPKSVHKPLTMLDDFHTQYSRLIDTLKQNGTRPVLLSLPLIDSERYFNHISKGLNAQNILEWLGGDVDFIGHWHDMYNMAVWGLGAEKRIPVIDITSPFLKRKDYRDYLCSDGIHPNEEGHRLIADVICDYVNSRKVQSL